MAAADTTFNQHRNLLFTLAYEILGSVHDAEDVVQESWLAWSSVEADRIEHPKAYLVRIAVRQALARSRRLRAAREDYVGPWLPEPLLTEADPTEADPAEAVSRAEELTFGLLVVLETLSPLERAAFVLREGFGYEHAEIARVLERSPAAARQLIHRAREHVQARRPRFPADPDLARQAAERFLAATLGGHLGDLMDVLAPDVTLWTDGGGAVRAALRPVSGAAKVARLLAKLGPRYGHLRTRWLPGSQPTALLTAEDELLAVLVLDLDAVTARARHIYGIVNPEKLTHLSSATSCR
ncbi:RNA polymerase sigma factor SigJ [Actinocorallia populi]|uniref:RNA polymerase sigma-70 factor n=2 Tax=Actinocorallia libanotica TaxID=46162 RepID=A0ABN1RWB5_9ACTN|nr:RNA polymerase sigma factor SigJ [Actinocorallia populi]